MSLLTDPGFKLGAFTHPDKSIRRAAIDLNKASGIDAVREMAAADDPLEGAGRFRLFLPGRL